MYLFHYERHNWFAHVKQQPEVMDELLYVWIKKHFQGLVGSALQLGGRL